MKKGLNAVSELKEILGVSKSEELRVGTATVSADGTVSVKDADIDLLTSSNLALKTGDRVVLNGPNIVGRALDPSSVITIA